MTDDDSAASRASNISDDELAAMMAFQEQDDDDDPNIVFLQDDDNSDDDDEDEVHPHFNNPAAVALRARFEQNRQRALNAAELAANASLLRRFSSNLRYAQLSFLAAFALIFYTMRTRQQFYLTVLYLQSSKLSYIILGNAVIASAVSGFTMVTKLFLGGLRVNERDAIGEHIRWDVTETCLALTIFRSEMDVGTTLRFLGLVVMKCLHWSVELRGSHLRMTEEVFIYPEERNPAPENDTEREQRKKLAWYKRLPYFRMSHIRFCSLLYILMAMDVVAAAHCALSVATDGPSVSILFGFEFAILLVSALSGLSMYHVHVVDGVVGFLHHLAEGEHHHNAVGAMAEPARYEDERGDNITEQHDQSEAVAAPNSENASQINEGNTNRQKTLTKVLVERIANPWKSRRATISFAIELQAQASKFLFYIVFFAIVFTYYGMPINIMREVYVAFQQLRRRLIAFNNYRRLTYNMESRFESIENDEELDRLGHTCIICRDQMDLGCKKLPICGHAFHTHCLREWLVQQQSCPTCRADIAANEARRKKELQRAASVAAVETETEQVSNNSDIDVNAADERIEAAGETAQIAALEESQLEEERMTDNAKQNQSTSPSDQTQGKSNEAELTALIPGWVEEWDPVSNRTYYWNKNTKETSWSRPVGHTDILLQPSTVAYEHNDNWNGQLCERDALQRQSNEATENVISVNFPYLFRIKNPLGARVFERHMAESKRVIPDGKIIVCTSVEYWPEKAAPMYRIPDGYVNCRDVDEFLQLETQSAVTNSTASGIGVETG